ncbi:MAG: glycoside hydrolase family 38 C-terminal domain-containing protein [Tetrasphaera sp.]
MEPRIGPIERILRRGRRALSERIAPAAYKIVGALAASRWIPEDRTGSIEAALAAPHTPVAVGDRWGAPWTTTWFRFEGRVGELVPRSGLEVVIDLGFDDAMPGFQAEGLAYAASGRPLKGVSPRNAAIPVAALIEPDGRLVLHLEAAANPTVLPFGRGARCAFRPTRLGDRDGHSEEPIYRLDRADLVLPQPDILALRHDLEVLLGVLAEPRCDEGRRQQIARAVDHALDALELSDAATAAGDCRARLAASLAAPGAASSHRVLAVGHAHIDSAWLWPLGETRRKCARTFANVTALAADFPELVFACPAAQHHAWVKEDHPAIWDRVRAAVAAGAWVPVGGMWVESDGNLVGGEALVRQFVHGQGFFLREFGSACEEVWLPDSFGYSAAFPQIARLAGAKHFLTQKLSWNDTNRLPNHTFDWEGIDGTRVFTHCPPVDTYNAEITPGELAHAAANFVRDDSGSISLLPFGFGDGGGGPTREMIERGRRLGDLDGAVRVSFGSPAEFFAAARAELPSPPVWAGELYLEFHRGVFTSQAATKAGNRRSEHLLHEAELWAVTADLAGTHRYPAARLASAWQRVLLLQFHDILPGSSIGWVHDEAAETYAEVATELQSLTGDLLTCADGRAQPAAANAGPFGRGEVVVGSAQEWGEGVAVQPLANGRNAIWAEVDALSCSTIQPPTTPIAPVVVESNTSGHALDNGLIRVTVDARGLLVSAFDHRSGRELIPPDHAANLLQVHGDHPSEWDAWNLDVEYDRSGLDLTAVEHLSVIASGPLLAEVAVERRHGATTLTQTITLRAGSRTVDFGLDIDWQERERLLKVAFPTDLRATESRAEVQFGHVSRPISTNTSWDRARYELWCHRWVEVREGDFGQALVTTATYGYDARRTTRPDGGTTTTVRLSLLRAPQYPQPNTDRGRHRLDYALVVGGTAEEVLAAAYAANLPMRVGQFAERPAPVAVDGVGIVVEAVKLAEDGSGDLVVRLYESRGVRACGTIRFAVPVEEVSVVDLLERPLREAALRPVWRHTGEGVEVTMRPFQIVTLRARRSSGRR